MRFVLYDIYKRTLDERRRYMYFFSSLILQENNANASRTEASDYFPMVRRSRYNNDEVLRSSARIHLLYLSRKLNARFERARRSCVRK